MKRTLTLLALMVLAGMQAGAKTESVFADGYTKDNYRQAYNYTIYGSMCWAANASNVIAWWQDRMAAQGYAVPEDAPKQLDVYPEYKAAFTNKGGYTDSAMEWWLDGYYYGQKSAEGHPGTYYDGMFVQEHDVYHSDTLITQFFPATQGSLEGFSQQIIESFQNGYALTARIQEKSYNITIWGADYDTTTGLLTALYYSDPHDSAQVWHGDLERTTDASGTDTYYLWAMGTVTTISGLTCHVEDFLTEAAYTDTGDGAFSPVCNAVVDKGAEYTLARELKAAAEDSALYGKARGNLTIKDGTATIAEGGSLQGSVVFSDAAGEADRKLAVTRDGLAVGKLVVNATEGGNELEISAGKTMTLTSMEGEGVLALTGEGTLVNGGQLGNIVLESGVLKGSGTFEDVTVDGGTLIVGSSPGRQEYLGDLTVNVGEVVFSVDGWDTPATGDNCGWASGTYSNIAMDGGSLTLGNGGTLEFALGGGAVAALLENPGTEFKLTIATGFGNGNEFTSELLLQLAQQTIFTYSTEEGAFTDTRPQLQDGETLNTHITGLQYELVDNTKLCVSGVYWRDVPPVPEPTTSTLSLLALAALAARRRKKI